jgi:hypothetical protein
MLTFFDEVVENKHVLSIKEYMLTSGGINNAAGSKHATLDLECGSGSRPAFRSE